MNITNLFPTAVGFSKLDRDLTEQELVCSTRKRTKKQTEFISTKMVTSASRFQQKTGTIGIVKAGGLMLVQVT